MSKEEYPPGRPTKLTPELIGLAKTYLENCAPVKAEYLPTIEGLALELHIHRDTLYSWAKDSQEFSDILEELRQAQANKLLQKGIKGEYNSTIAKLILSGKHNYVERSEVDQNLNGSVSFINDVPRPKKESRDD